MLDSPWGFLTFVHNRAGASKQKKPQAFLLGKPQLSARLKPNSALSFGPLAQGQAMSRLDWMKGL
jgi:hypothetical protein